MAFSDWTFLTQNSGTHGLDTVTTITGTSSLKLTTSSPGSVAIVEGFISTASGIPHGFTRGAIRTLFQPVTQGSNRVIGLAAMLDSRSAPPSNCYSASLNGSNILLTRGSLGSGSTLGTYAYTMTNGVTFALELEWIAALDEVNGTALTVRFAESDDFDDMVDIITYVDTSSPIYVSRGEGIFCIGGFGSGTSDWRVDETTIYRID